MNMYVQPKKRNLKQQQDKYKQFSIKFNETMNNKKLTNYQDLRGAVVDNVISHADKSLLRGDNKKVVSEQDNKKINEYG